MNLVGTGPKSRDFHSLEIYEYFVWRNEFYIKVSDLQALHFSDAKAELLKFLDDEPIEKVSIDSLYYTEI